MNIPVLVVFVGIVLVAGGMYVVMQSGEPIANSMMDMSGQPGINIPVAVPDCGDSGDVPILSPRPELTWTIPELENADRSSIRQTVWILPESLLWHSLWGTCIACGKFDIPVVADRTSVEVEDDLAPGNYIWGVEIKWAELTEKDKTQSKECRFRVGKYWTNLAVNNGLVTRDRITNSNEEKLDLSWVVEKGNQEILKKDATSDTTLDIKSEMPDASGDYRVWVINKENKSTDSGQRISNIVMINFSIVTPVLLTKVPTPQSSIQPQVTTVTIPNVIGMDAKEAKYLLESHHFSVNIEDGFSDMEYGQIFKQIPEAGTSSSPSTTTIIIYRTYLISIPNVIGMDYTDAENKLESLHLNVSVEDGPSDMAYGQIYQQIPEAGTYTNPSISQVKIYRSIQNDVEPTPEPVLSSTDCSFYAWGGDSNQFHITIKFDYDVDPTSSYSMYYAGNEYQCKIDNNYSNRLYCIGYTGLPDYGYQDITIYMYGSEICNTNYRFPKPTPTPKVNNAVDPNDPCPSHFYICSGGSDNCDFVYGDGTSQYAGDGYTVCGNQTFGCECSNPPIVCNSGKKHCIKEGGNKICFCK